MLNEQSPAAQASGDEGAVALREYLAVLRTRKWGIAAITLVTVVAALLFSFRQTPIYQSEAQVLVNPVPTAGYQSIIPPAPNLDTERAVASSLEVAEVVATRLDGTHDPEVLLRGLSVQVATNSEVLVFSYSDPRPLEAQRRAQAFVQAYLSFRRERALEGLLQVQESIQEQIDEVSGELQRVNRRIGNVEDENERATLQTRASQLAAQIAVLEGERSRIAPAGQLSVGDIIAAANLPSSPASPNHILNGALALLAGLALGVGFAFLRERLDDRLRGQSDLEARSGAPVLAVVPRVAGWKKRSETPLVSMSDPRSGAAEAYRTLRTGILFAAQERGIRVVLVTSPHPGEGKTATAANLAVVLAQAGKRVIVISADLRKPRLHRFFGGGNGSGLSRLLTGEDGVGKAVQDVGMDHLRMVASGPVPKNPAELLGSRAMAQALEHFREASDLVIIDAPPVLNVADTITLAPLADAVILVADAERTSRGALSEARKQLEQVRAPIVGSVLNNLDPAKARMYPYYYRYYYRYGYRYVDKEPAGGPAPEAAPPVRPSREPIIEIRPLEPERPPDPFPTPEPPQPEPPPPGPPPPPPEPVPPVAPRPREPAPPVEPAPPPGPVEPVPTEAVEVSSPPWAAPAQEPAAPGPEGPVPAGRDRGPNGSEGRRISFDDLFREVFEAMGTDDPAMRGGDDPGTERPPGPGGGRESDRPDRP